MPLLKKRGGLKKLRGSAMGIKKELLDILACPKCKGDLVLTLEEDGLVCKNCKLLYEIREDIPVMLIDEAKEWNETIKTKDN